MHYGIASFLDVSKNLNIMREAALSIKNSFPIMSAKACILNLTFLTLFNVAPVTVHGFYHFQQQAEQIWLPDFNSPDQVPAPSKSYVIQQNRDGNPETSYLQLKSSVSDAVAAMELNVDIPFNLLAQTTAGPQFSLDRQIASSMRLKNIMDEYLALTRRSAELMTSLDIPYLNRSFSDKTQSQETSQPAREDFKNALLLKKELTGIVRYQGSIQNTSAADFPHPATDLVQGQGEKVRQPPGGLRPYRTGQNYDVATKPASYYVNSVPGNQDQLPWIFTLALSIIRYITENKVEILLCVLLSAMVLSFGIAVVKK